MSQGTLCFVVSNPAAPVHQWSYTKSYINTHQQLHWYSAVARHGNLVYFVGSLEDESNMRRHKTVHGEIQEKGMVMSRIQVKHMVGLQWEQMQYWDGNAWAVHTDSDSLPALKPILYYTGGGETTLHWNEQLGLWYMLLSTQHLQNQIMMHYSVNVEGPWESVSIYQPVAPFNETQHYMCYATKAHPSLAATNEIVFSYVCTKRPWTWPGMTNVYVPQFVRVRLLNGKVVLSPEVQLTPTTTIPLETTSFDQLQQRKLKRNAN